MELPSRPKGDIYARPGEYAALRARLRSIYAGDPIPSVVVSAFDERTRLMPYYFTSHIMAPAGARAIATALVDCGLAPTRVVFQQWTPRFRPSEARLDGRPIQMLLVSSMKIHAARAYALVADALRMGPDRPLVITGGPKAIYEPEDFFGIGGEPAVSADLVVTGEDFVLVQLLDVLSTYRNGSTSMLDAFRLARRDAALDGVPGLVYRAGEDEDAPLVSSGIQKLVQDLDEFPHPVAGYSLLEPPHRRTTLSAAPLPVSAIRRKSRIASLTLSHGCKFNCDYCPIPAYNQRTYRHKSGERIADEMRRIREELGIRMFFGTDDNFFNNRPAVEEMFSVLSRTKVNGRAFHREVFWGTEATEFDTWKNRDLLPAARLSGLRAIWFGIEDMTATLIRKGQSVSKTGELFSLLLDTGISPRPMLMHHDGQPLYSRKGLYGLLNQAMRLRKLGANSFQATVLTPAVGTRAFEPTLDKGVVFRSVGGRPVDEWEYDGNHVVASAVSRPWRLQFNVLMAYLAFYNPWNLTRAFFRPKRHGRISAVFCQAAGMYGLARSALHFLGTTYRLWRGPIERVASAPAKPAAMSLPVLESVPA